MEIVAIIPARGGSKGIPRKNLRPLNGLPLVAHAILLAQKVQQVNRVIVSTDDEEIAEVARGNEAEVVLRPPEISGDSATAELALLHALESLEQAEAYRPDLVVFLQCTSPLTASDDVEGTISALLQEQADSALAVTSFHYFLWRRTGTGDAVGINHDKGCRPLRQEKETQFLETGAVYVMRTEGFRRARHRFFGKTVLHVIPRERCLEIDEPGDLAIAEWRLANQSNVAVNP